MLDDHAWPFVGREDELLNFRRLLLDTGSRGLVLAGASGVGKTRTATECLAIARGEAGCHPARASGHQASAELPFGALAHLLPEVDRGQEATLEDRGGLLRRLASALVGQAGKRRLVLLVDDAHLLDDPSAALLYQLAVSSPAFILATVRAGETAPDAIVALWKDGLLDRRDLVGLRSQVIEELLSAALGGRVDPQTTMTLAARCEGNVLFLRELVLGGLADESLRMENGMWRLVQPLRPSNRLVELVGARLRGLAREERELLELVSFGEPLGQVELQTLGDLSVAEGLERKGLLTVELHQGRMQVRLGHPVYGDVIRTGLPRLRVQSMARALAESVESSGVLRGEDLLRIGSWRLLGGGGSPQLMLAAASAARWRYDFALADRLVAAAQKLGAGFEADLLAAKLASVQGFSDAAEAMFAALAKDAVGDEQRSLVTIGQMDNFLYASRSMDSLRVASEAEASIRDLRWRDEITARRSANLVAVAGPRATLEAVSPLLAGTGSPAALVWACLTGAHSLARLGRCQEAVTLTERGHAAQLKLRQPIEWYPWFHLFNRCDALLGVGRLRDAEQVAMVEYQTGLDQHSQEAQACFALQLAKVCLAQGRVRSAADRAREAVGVFRRIVRPMFLHEALMILALAVAQIEGATESSAVLVELDQADVGHLTYDAVDVLQARSWDALVNGHVGRACQLLEEAATLGQESGDLVVASSALHDLARLGRARQVTQRLDHLETQIDAGLINLRAAHARYLATDNGTGLQEVSESFAGLGADLLAADAAADAAVAFTRVGNSRAATAATRLALAHADVCEGASTPSLRSIDARARLTPAERETAMLAAAGRSNKEIATELVLSVRSVENRLQRVYEKLGICARTALAQALDLSAPWEDVHQLVKTS
jgi:DNA-binding CsgD family transcriptional regulator